MHSDLDVYDDNGVDRSLIRVNLARTPTERLLALERFLNDLALLRRPKAPKRTDRDT